MAEVPDFASRLQRLEDESALRRLVALYGRAVDHREPDLLGGLFTEDAEFGSVDGVMRASGRAAIVNFYRGRFAVLGPTFHYTHDHLLEFSADDANVATGVVTAHSEAARDGVPMLAAIRYLDRYRRVAAGWQFAERKLAFFYYLSATDYPLAFRDALRMRGHGTPQPADWPEGLASWQHYYAG
jgi:hypothetical protein